MALTEVAICNMALSRLGISRVLTGDVDGTLAACTDSTVAKAMLDIWYPRKRNALLEMYPWSFALKYATLVLNDDGDGEIWEDEWDYAYTYPSDCLRMRRFVTDTGTGWYLTGYQESYRFRPEPWPFVVGTHGTPPVKVIFTDVTTSDADVEYTALVTDAGLFPEDFSSGLAWLLSAEVARPMSVDNKRAMEAEQAAQYILSAAAASNKNEQEPRPEGDGTFVTSRWGS